MTELILVLGNRNYSSWSMRAWLACRQTGTPFREETVWLDEDLDRRQRLAHSPAGRVPILRHGSLTIWDSLAIAEYLAELFPGAGLWPADRAARARARSLCSEMHSGFTAIRERMPLNCRARKAPADRGEDVAAEIRRVCEIWTGTRAEHGGGGPFLFGALSLADAFFAPVASRFQTYAVPLQGAAAEYSEALLGSPPVREWVAAAAAESHVQTTYDALP